MRARLLCTLARRCSYYLSIADARGDATPEEALASEAARLFIERARLQRPELEITPKDATPLASMCRRLDGIGLDIELAAPRVRTMSIGELSRRIDDRFSLLAEGSRTALPRHRTLSSLIDWSHDLLNDAEKRRQRAAGREETRHEQPKQGLESKRVRCQGRWRCDLPIQNVKN